MLCAGASFKGDSGEGPQESVVDELPLVQLGDLSAHVFRVSHLSKIMFETMDKLDSFAFCIGTYVTVCGFRLHSQQTGTWLLHVYFHEMRDCFVWFVDAQGLEVLNLLLRDHVL